jgi:hypothetical protein
MFAKFPYTAAKDIKGMQAIAIYLHGLDSVAVELIVLVLTVITGYQLIKHKLK